MSSAENAVQELQDLLISQNSRVLEELACDLLGRLVGVVFSRARSGNQRGGDGGVRQISGRHLIYEAKCYGTNTKFDNRSIRGEIDEAVERNSALEAWILVTTREVPEQTLTAMEVAGRPRGVETLTVDWMPTRLPRLAALCAWAPDAVKAATGHDCQELLAKIRTSEHFAEVLEFLSASVRDSVTGYEVLRQASHNYLQKVWADRQTAESCFGQNVAGGDSRASHIERPEPMAGLDAWDLGAVGSRDEPALVVGREGMGKTWAVIDWLQSRLERLPIVVLAPSTVLTAPIAGRSALVGFIARLLRDLDQATERGDEYWEARVTRLLQRPANEGAVLMLFFDGMNEEPSYNWEALLNQLQGEPFHGRIRVVASARNSFVEERLDKLQGWAWTPTPIEVGSYDETPGGEFDKRLEAAKLTRDDLPGSLVELARTPRLFDLVVGLRNRLGGVEGVTVHRLFWEYGATAIRTNSFSVGEWHAFVLQLAKEFMKGRKLQSRQKVEKLGASSTIDPDAVYQRVSSIIDGAFAKSLNWDDVEFEEEFVRYSLGLALVRKLDEKNGSASKEVLGRFFEPLNDHDEEAEIIRAAVSIALARGSDQAGAFLGQLCSRWVRCQNFPEIHLQELAGLAGELIEPLLDAIEATGGHVLTTPRYRAVNALITVDSSDTCVARAIANRGERWLGCISQERAVDGADSDAERVQRRKKRLESRIGTGDSGCVRVLGREIKIVEQTDQGLRVVAAQLLQGRPLVEAIGFFEAGALHSAICRERAEEQGWLNLVNDIDPVETAERLREQSEAMLRRQPEDGVHEQLNARVAAILLWRTGYKEDAQRALEIDPGIDRPTFYSEEYEKDPAESSYELERRHVDATLRRKDLALRFRIDRTNPYLLDPSLALPKSLVDEAIREARGLDWDNMAKGRSRTAEDWTWRDLSRVLARGAPDELAQIERERLRGFAGREGEARFGAAMAAPDTMLLVSDAERKALRELRERVPPEPDDSEWFLQGNILIAEIQGESAIDQIYRILNAELDGIDSSLVRACGSPSTAELEKLVKERLCNPQALQKVATVIYEKSVTLGEGAFDAFAELLFGEYEGVELDPVWVVLGQNAPERLGNMLDQRDWTWSGKQSYFEKVMGSVAVAAANRQTPFASFATRLAPNTILPIISERGSVREEVLLAIEMLHSVVMQSAIPVPETALEVSHNRSEAEETVNYFYSHGDIRETDEVNGTRRFFSRLREDYKERQHSLAKQYSKDVMDARREGANFLLEFVRPKHLKAVVDYCPDKIDEWLNGMSERTPEFTRRVLLADGFFVSLCETLLAKTPEIGVELWRALNHCLKHTKYTVHGDMDRLRVALFAADSSPNVEKALAEVYGLDGTHTDRELINLVVAARLHGRLDWLYSMVAEDAASNGPLNHRRAEFLNPLLSVPEIADEGRWPQGDFNRSVHGLSWKLGQREAFAQHWLLEFAKAESEIEAHAAWQLFLAGVDRRAWSWFWDVLDQNLVGEGGLNSVKQRFVEQQNHEIRRAIGKNEQYWESNYTYWRYPDALKPWN
ncbi:MAG: hypothetical protein F4Y22_12515 [Gammaproteobacteria bacterium]|nr:hypothetical protein [Gammaproteobacteria bacterium]MYH45335.1 hypothetical protein [Gammaproteobacteria bacterium]MYL14220.1 hypothetical protein [Gammaproteobacteria bacterium]